MGRPRKQPPVPPSLEDEDADDGASDVDDPDVPESEKPDPILPSRSRMAEQRSSPLDEPVARPGAAPGAVQFPIGGFGGVGAPPPMPGRNFIPPLGSVGGFPGFGPAQSHSGPGSASREEQRPYAEDAEPIRADMDGSSDATLSRAFLGQYPDDMRVDVEVWQCDGAQDIPRGRLENISLSYARVPTRYIPYGGIGGTGQWQIEFFSNRTGKPLARKRVSLPGEEPPADYRVENVVAEQEALKALIRAMTGQTGLVPAGVPTSVYADEKAWLRQQVEDQKKALEDLRRQMEQDRRDSERRMFEDRIRVLESGGARGGQPSEAMQMFGAILPIIAAPKNDGFVDLVLRMNGPEAMMSQAAMYNTMLETALKVNKGAGDGDDWFKGAFKGAAERMVDGYQKRADAQQDYLRKRQEKKEAEDAAAKAKAAGSTAPAASAEAKGNGGGTDRALFARMIGHFKAQLAGVMDPAVPADRKATAEDAGRSLALAAMTGVDLGIHQTDALVKGMIDELLTDPEMTISKFAVLYKLDAVFAASVAMYYRRFAGMSPLVAKAAAAPVVAPPPAPAPPAPVVADVASPAAPEPPPVVGTIRLPSAAPAEKPPSPVPAAVTVDATAAMHPRPEAPVAAAGPVVAPSPEVEGKDAVVADVHQAEGAGHVVDTGPVTAPAQREQAGDPDGEGGKPPEKDAVGLADAPAPAAEVEKPAVP